MTDLVDVEAFAGPGGWSEGRRLAGARNRSLGFELDPAACRTATAAGHVRVRADVSRVPLKHLAGLVDGVMLSPPCTTFSNAGHGAGRRLTALLAVAMTRTMRGENVVAWARREAAKILRPVAMENRKLRKATRAERAAWVRRQAVTSTHQPYRAGREHAVEPDLFGDPLPPPVSMAEALGWGDLVDLPAWTGTGGGTACTRSLDEPAGTLFFGQRTNAVDWVMRSNYGTSGDAQDRGERTPDQPAATVTGKVKGALWVRQTEVRMWPAGTEGSYGYSREATAPSPTIKGSGTGGQYWTADQRNGDQTGTESVRVTVQEAAVLQSFPADYPWQGNKSEQYRQVGDAIPPLLAARILEQLVLRAGEGEAVA